MLNDFDLLKVLPNERERIAVLLNQHITMKFYLTGSYALGGHTKDSDLDFFTDSNTFDRKCLITLGFHREDVTISYRDVLTRTVYTHDCGIHIQETADVDLKLRAQTILRERHMLGCFLASIKKNCTPATASEIWNLAIELARRERGA